MTGKLDKCEHGQYGYEQCEPCATAALVEHLRTSTTMLEALLVQLNSWGHESAVNARGQIWNNEELLRRFDDA